MAGAPLSITFQKNSTRLKIPRVLFLRIKNKILGQPYDLSLAFVSPAESKKLNRRYRKKNKPANILTFPLSKKSGEIVISPAVARRDAPKFGLSPRHFLGLLFIHGLLHLKGASHGSRMEHTERALLKKFIP